MNYVKTIWALLPPVIAIIFALKTKEVYISLLIGIVSGTLLLTNFHLVESLNLLFDTVVNCLSKPSNIGILIFLVMLGIIVTLMTKSGGSQAYGKWASKIIRTKRSSLLLTSLLGCLIFLDDYFNCLTVGTVMKPITDRHHVSRAKLAYIIDATAAPICIIAPISSWAAAVGSYLKNTGAFDSEFKAFITAIPYNFYAILSLLMVFLLCVFSLDFGPMAKQEVLAERGFLGGLDEQKDSLAQPKSGRVADMIVPILVLIVTAILGMLYNGGYWSNDPSLHTITAALGNCVAAQALVWGSFAGIITALFMYIPRKIMTFKEFMDNFTKGMQQMITSGCILMLAWTIGGVCRDLLSTPVFVKTFIETTGLPGALLPALVFILAAFLSFSTGTSWGTFGILIPIIIPVAQSICPELLLSSLAATLAGSVFGDHCSPISDTTILSSAGAGVNHLTHVSTQMIYALTVAGCSLIGYLIIGITNGNLLLSLGTSIFILCIFTFIMHRRSKTILNKKDICSTQ